MHAATSTERPGKIEKADRRLASMRLRELGQCRHHTVDGRGVGLVGGDARMLRRVWCATAEGREVGLCMVGAKSGSNRARGAEGA